MAAAQYQVHHTHDAARALAATEAFLASDPVAHNVVLSVLAERAAHPQTGDCWWVDDGDATVLGVALASPTGHPLSLTPMGGGTIDALVAVVAGGDVELTGVVGEAAAAARFAGAWTEATGVGAAPREGQRLYRLGTVVAPDGVAGGPVVAGPDHLELLLAWWGGLAADLGEPAPGPGAPDVLRQRIAGGELWLWCVEDRPVSMARLTPPAAGAVRVGFVYTPPELRRRGYAAASVAALSAHARAHQATECLLYTQLANPTSNGIYRRIGYEAVAEVLAYTFSVA